MPGSKAAWKRVLVPFGDSTMLRLEKAEDAWRIAKAWKRTAHLDADKVRIGTSRPTKDVAIHRQRGAWNFVKNEKASDSLRDGTLIACDSLVC